MPESEANTDELLAAPEAAAAEVTSKSQRLFVWKWIFPFEIVAWAGLVVTVVFLRSHGLRIDWVTVEYTIFPLLPVMGKSFVTGVICYTVYTALRGRSPLDYLRQIATPGWFLLTARLWIALIIFTYSYVWLKVCIPLVNPRLWDETLWNLDILLHGGISPSVFVSDLLTSAGLARGIDVWYIWWLPSVSNGIAFVCAFPSNRLRRRFVLSIVLIWTVGPWIYTAIPALGPIYVYPEHWSDAAAQMPHADSAQHLLADNYQKVIEGRDQGTLRQFNPTRGIAAMPSLHVGLHWLFMLWIRRYARPLFVPALLGVLLTFVGSIATGWHYAVDGYVGIALAQAVYWLSLRWDRPPSQEGPDAPEGLEGQEIPQPQSS